MPSRYPWLSYRDAHAYEAEAAARGVSAVARGSKGFMREYEKARSARDMATRPLPPGVTGGATWGQKRDGFVARHLAQYDGTRRRYLALLMWAYKPPGPAPPA